MLFRCIFVCLVFVTVSSLPPFRRPTWPRTSTSLTSEDLQNPSPWIKFSYFGNVLNQFPKIVPDIAEAGPKIETDNKRFQVIINVKDYKKENLKTEIKGDYIIIQGLGVNNDFKSSLTSEFSQIYSLPPKSNPSSVTSVLTSDGYLVLNAPLGNVAKKNKIEKVIPITESKEPLHTQELINKSNDVPVLPLYKLVKNENTNSIIEIPQNNDFKEESVTNENKFISLNFAPQQVEEKEPFLSYTLPSPTNNNNNVQLETETLESEQKIEPVLKTSVKIKFDDMEDHQSENKNKPLTEEVTLKPQQLTTLVNVELGNITTSTILEDSKTENNKYESSIPTISAVLKANVNNNNDEIKADTEVLKSVNAIDYINETKVPKIESLQETSANVKLEDIEAYQSKNKSELLTDGVTLKPQQLTTLAYAELSNTVTSIILKASKFENSKDESGIATAILKTNAYNQNDETKAETITLKSVDAKDDISDNKKIMLEINPVQETIIDIKFDDIVANRSENRNEHLTDEVTLKPQQLTTLANVELSNTVTATILEASNIENKENKESSIATVTTILQTHLNNQNNDLTTDLLKNRNDVSTLPTVSAFLEVTTTVINDSDVTEEILEKSDALEKTLVSTTDVTTTLLNDSELYTNKQPNKINDPVISEPVNSESINQISTTTATLQEQAPLSQKLSQEQIVEHNDVAEKNNFSLEKSNTAQDAISINIPLPTTPYTAEKSDLSSALEAVRERISDDIRLIDESLLPELDQTHTFDTIQKNVEGKPAVTSNLDEVNGNIDTDKTTLIKEQSLPITADQLFVSETDSTILSAPSAILLPPLDNVEISKTNTFSDKSSSVINPPAIKEIDSTILPTLQSILPNVANNNIESNKVEVINDQSSTVTINQAATTNIDSTVLGSEQAVLSNVEISNPTITLSKTYSIAEPVSTVISPASETHFDIST